MATPGSKASSAQLARVASITAATLHSITTVVTRSFVTSVGALPLAFMRYTLGSLLLLVAAAAMSAGGGKPLRVKLRDLPLLAAVGILYCTILPIFFTSALNEIPAARGSLLYATAPLFALGFAHAMKKDRLGLRQNIGIALTIIGIGVIASHRSGINRGNLKGDLLMLGAAFSIAASGVLTKPALARYSSFTVVTYRMLIGATMLLPVALFTDGFFFAKMVSYTPSTWAALGVLGISGGALGGFLWTYAYGYLAPGEVLMYHNLSPVITMLLSTIFLGEKLSTTFIIAFVIVISGVILGGYRKKGHGLAPTAEKQLPATPVHPDRRGVGRG